MVRLGLSLADPARVADEAREAERSGYDVVAVGEHVFHHGPVPSPFVQLAAAAAVTDRVRLLSSMHLLPLYPAVLSAKLAATLDVVSAGRLDLGIGAGGEYPAEFRAMGVDPATRVRRLEEGLDVLQCLFTGERVSHDGEFTSFADAALDPPPVQQGGPPIWLGGRRDKALERAGRRASTWMPYMVTPDQFATGLAEVRAAAAASGRDPEAVDAALFVFVCVDADGQWARRTGAAAVGRTYEQDFSGMADRYLLLGSPDEVCERIQAYAAAGADTLVLHVATGPDDRRRVLDTLAERVLPVVAG